ncbi:MAG: SymE family type I addiction module toxin [Lachnospiraceae bacterium]|nr:SymE family type I addiction module toxin [Lachnospiraceae bacterium]
MITNKRDLKVYGTFIYRDKSYRPQIKLEGLWLAASGFDVGDRISVACEDGRLTISRYDTETDGAA